MAFNKKKKWWNIAGKVVVDTMFNTLFFSWVGVSLFGVKPPNRKYLYGLSALFSLADSARRLDADE